jgi:hypothetical protein
MECFHGDVDVLADQAREALDTEIRIAEQARGAGISLWTELPEAQHLSAPELERLADRPDFRA